LAARRLVLHRDEDCDSLSPYSINSDELINLNDLSHALYPASNGAPSGDPVRISQPNQPPTGDNLMLTVGDKFPAITVPVQQGSALPAGETINLGETDGKWKIVFFWPKDFTFVCPTEIIGYGELLQDFADRDAQLIGASTDTDFVHHAWRKADERLA
jgi:hypothetical protein